MSHYIVDPTRSCGPCACTVPRMCNQRHYDQVLYVRESKLFNTPTVGVNTFPDFTVFNMYFEILAHDETLVVHATLTSRIKVLALVEETNTCWMAS